MFDIYEKIRYNSDNLGKGHGYVRVLRRNCYKFVTITAGGKTFQNKVNAEIYSDFKGKRTFFRKRIIHGYYRR